MTLRAASGGRNEPSFSVTVCLETSFPTSSHPPLRHVNIAKVVGVTQGYNGLNGMIVTMGKLKTTILKLFDPSLVNFIF